jgi:hypothetical protein
MATKYFQNFPIVEYDGQKIRDITRRNTFIKNVSTNPLSFQPYTVHEGERPEDIANFYYGSTDYTWLVYLSNNIVDPYHEWPKATEDFNNYLIDKYREVSGKKGNDILEWTREESDENIIYYYREINPVFNENVESVDDSENQSVEVDLSQEVTESESNAGEDGTGGGIIY